MQPDFSKMAQGQKQPNKTEFTTEEVKAGLPVTKENLEKSGYPSGDSREEMKGRFLKLFEQLGLMELYNTPAKQQQLAADLEEMINLILSKNFAGLEKNELYMTFQKYLEQSEMQGQAQPQAKPQAAGPTNFAGMVPPGGGMSGR